MFSNTKFFLLVLPIILAEEFLVKNCCDANSCSIVSVNLTTKTATNTPSPTKTATNTPTPTQTGTPAITPTPSHTPGFTGFSADQQYAYTLEILGSFSGGSADFSGAYAPHPVFTNELGEAVEQLNGIAIGGFDGLNN